MLRTGEGTPPELEAVRWEIFRWTRGRGVELGRGSFKAYPHFVGLREHGDKTVLPDVAPDLACETFVTGMQKIKDVSLDFVFAFEVDCGEALLSAEIKRALKPDGHVVYVTDGKLFVDRLVAGDFVTVDQRIEKWDRKTACMLRYGAIGDTIQAASVLPELKRQGYHITVMCEPIVEEVLRNDPNVDQFFIQDRDQIPNHELIKFWNHWAPKFDKWVNLCGAVEDNLLLMPGKPNYFWPKALRHQRCNANYLEFMAAMADLPFHPEHHFYPTAEEDASAQARIEGIRATANRDRQQFERSVDPYVIMWVLSGSSIHKFYPHQDTVIRMIMGTLPDAHVIFVGDHACKLLEQGWEEEPRVVCLSGELSLRDSLTLAKHAHLVIGPETGIVNAVGFESMPKVVMLSHSTAENLTRDWVNTEALASHDTPCYPCHRLHYNRDHCPEHKETGAAMCQFDLAPEDVFAAVQRAYEASRFVQKLLTP